MLEIVEGKIIEFRDKKRIITSVCTKKGKELRVLTYENKEFNLPVNKVINVSSETIDINLPKNEILNKLKDYYNKSEEIKKQIDLTSLWDLLKDEIIEYHFKELAEIYFNTKPDFIHYSAILKALTEDNIYFELKGEGFFKPNTKEQVDKLFYQKEIEKNKLKEWQYAVEWVKNNLNTSTISNPELNLDKYIQLLKNTAIYGSEYKDYDKATEFLKELGYKGSDIKGKAFEYLVKLNIFDIDENLYLYQYNIKEQFNENVLQEANSLINLRYTDNRVDLTDLTTITIDDVDTQDVDDAISLEIENNKLTVGIHIADVSEYVLKDTSIDKEALNRGSTIYLPDKTIEMLPKVLSESLCSLLPNKNSLALSVLVSFNKNYEIEDYKIIESIINVKNKLSYEEVDSKYLNDTFFEKLYNLAINLRQKRIENNAIINFAPELKIKVDSNKNITLKKINFNTYSQIIVSELMILANNLFAKWAWEKNIPLIYKVQAFPEQEVKFPLEYDPVYMYKNRLILKRAEFTVNPSSHYGLGLEVYTQMSSPIRRYLDLVNHRQVKNFIKSGNITYSKEELENILFSTSTTLETINLIQRQSNKYWLFKYLEQNKEQLIDATVLSVDDTKMHILLDDYCFETNILGKNLSVKDGEKIKVKIKSISPRQGSIVVERVI